jgi:hypothetical protein
VNSLVLRERFAFYHSVMTQWGNVLIEVLLIKLIPEQFTVKAQEPLFPNWLSVVTWLSVCVQNMAAIKAAILPVSPDEKLQRRLWNHLWEYEFCSDIISENTSFFILVSTCSHKRRMYNRIGMRYQSLSKPPKLFKALHKLPVLKWCREQPISDTKWPNSLHDADFALRSVRLHVGWWRHATACTKPHLDSNKRASRLCILIGAAWCILPLICCL